LEIALLLTGVSASDVEIYSIIGTHKHRSEDPDVRGSLGFLPVFDNLGTGGSVEIIIELVASGNGNPARATAYFQSVNSVSGIVAGNVQNVVTGYTRYALRPLGTGITLGTL
jgi:hypothetical protein